VSKVLGPDVVIHVCIPRTGQANEKKMSLWFANFLKDIPKLNLMIWGPTPKICLYHIRLIDFL
ncbi:hypothetical protein ACQP3F_30375, partial [Escherichia coli]